MPFDLSSARVVDVAEEDRIFLEEEIGSVTPVNAEAPAFDLSSAKVTDESAFDVSSAKVSPVLSQRNEIMAELDENPFARKLTMQMLDTEGGGTATMEALVNRTAMIRQKIPGWKLSDELTSGFYGPINSGVAQKRELDPGSISQYQRHIDEVRAGSNVIQGRTDQGYPGDPNWQGPGRVHVPDNPKEVYNYWTGKRRGVDFSHEDSAKFAMDLQGSGEGLTVEPSSNRERLSGAIADVEKAGYEVPHFIGKPNEPEGDRAPTMDMENLVAALKKREEAVSDQEKKSAIAKERAYWEDQIKTSGMSAEQWRQQTGEPDPILAPAKKWWDFGGDKESGLTLSDLVTGRRPGESDAKKEVGLIESAKRGLMSSSIGIGEAVNRYAYSPVVHGISEAIQAVAPESELAKKAKEFDDLFFKKTVEEPAAMRKKLEFDPETEKRTVAGMDLGKTGEVAGELSELGGALVPDIATAALTQGATAVKVIPTALKTAAPTIMNAIKSYAPQLSQGARSFIVPSMKAGMDAAKQAKEQGASEADQNAAFLTNTLKTMAMASVPMATKSRLATIPARVASRGAQGGALAGATGELERGASNIVLGEERPFSLTESFKQVFTGGVLGVAMGKKGAPATKLQQAKAPAPAAEVPTVSLPIPAGPEPRIKPLGAVTKKIVGEKVKIKGIEADPGRFIQGTAEIMEKNGFTALGQAIRNHIDQWRVYSGMTHAPIRRWAKGVNKADMAKAQGEFRNYWQSVDEQWKVQAAPAEVPLLGDERFAPKTVPKVRLAPTFEELKKEIHDLWPEAAANNLNPLYNGPWGKPLHDEFNKLPKDRREKIDKWFEDNDDAIGNARERKFADGRLRDIRENVGTPREFAFKIVDALRDFPDQKDYIMSGAREIVQKKGWSPQEIETAIKKELVQTYGADAKEMLEAFFPPKVTPTAQVAPQAALPPPSTSRVGTGGYPALMPPRAPGETPPPGKPVSDVSQDIYNAASPKGREIIDISKRLFSETGDIALANKLDVFNHETGKWRPFRKIAEGKFFPRRISEKWHEILSKPWQYPEQYAEMRRESVALGYIKQPADFDAYISRVLKTHTPDDLSPIEHARTSPLPTRVYDYGFDQMVNYLNNWSWDMARIETFGQQSRGRMDLFDKAQAMTSDTYSKGYIANVQKLAYRKQNTGAWSALFNSAQTVSTITMLGNYLYSMRNAIGGILQNANYNGVSSAAKSFTRIQEMAQHIDDATERGILQDNLFNIQENMNNLKSPAQKTLNVLFKYAGANLTEEWSRAMTLMSSMDFLRNAVAKNQIDPSSPEMIQIRARIQRIGGIDPEALLREGGQAGPLTDRFLRASVAQIQGGYQYDATPYTLNTPGGRVIFQFQKWGTMAADVFVKNVANPAVQAVSGGKVGKKETVQVPDGMGGMRTVKVPGDLLPAARFLLLSTAAGLTQKELQSFIFGIEDKEASFAEILSRLEKGDANAFGDLIQKVWMANMSVGAAGVIGNYTQLLADIDKRTRFKDPSAPPALAIPKLVVGAIVDRVTQGKWTGMDLDAYARNAFSAYRTVQGIASQLNNAFGGNILPLKAVAARNDITFLRSRTRRYDNVIGVGAPAMGGAPPTKTALTPFTAELKEALMMGDSLRAANLLDEHFAGRTRSQRDEEMKRIKSSVRGSQPIRAGGGSGEAMAANFLDWAGENLPMTEVMRIIDIDNRYVGTAIGLRLMDPRDPTMRERREALQKIENRRAFRK